MLFVILSILVCFLLAIGILLIYSPGNSEPFMDENGKPMKGSISEKVFTQIGGIQQGMFIKGKDLRNPVLLYLHGGPAFPNYFLMEKFNPGLEDHFTVCYWEQRGGGLSYHPGIPHESMTFEQLASDTIELSEYLRKYFRKKKIFLMAHSGGTSIGILTASRAPQLYEAYIGIAQISIQGESEKIAYKYILEKYRAAGNNKALKKLGKYPILESDELLISYYRSLTRDRSMHELGIGTMRNMKSVFFDIFLPIWTCRAYTIKEKVNIWISKFFFIHKTILFKELLETDFTAKIPALDIPVYFFSGKYDLTVNINLSKAYLAQLRAPVKGFYTFNESAHSPIYEEPGLLNEILVKDVLNGTTRLSDK